MQSQFSPIVKTYECMGTSQSPFLIQLILEGEGTLSFSQIRKSCDEINQLISKEYNCVTLRVDSVDRFTNKCLENLMEILVEESSPNLKIMFRVHHSLMDGRGALKFLEVLLKNCSEAELPLEIDFNNEQSFLSTCNDVPNRTYPRLKKKKYLDSYLISNDQFRFRNFFVDSLGEGTSSVLAVALGRVLKQNANVMFPIDIRRHTKGENQYGNLSLPIFKNITYGSSWQEVEAGLMSSLLRGEELKYDPLAPVLKFSPRPIIKFFLHLFSRYMSLSKRYPIDAVISYLGTIDSSSYTTKDFKLKNILSIAPQIPFSPLSIVAIDFDNKLSISLSSQAGQFLDKIRAPFVDELKRQTAKKIFSEEVEIEFDKKIVDLFFNVPANIFSDETRFTDQDFNHHVNKYLKLIGKHKLDSKSVIAIDTDRSADFVAIAYAIWRSGNIFLPLDQSLSIEQKRGIIEHSNAQLKIDQDSLPENIDSLALPETKFPKENDIAYIIYTSGTTGSPKGVKISFENLINYLEWSKKEYQLTEEHMFQFFTATSVDLSITSYILPCYIKANLRIYQESFENIILKKKFDFSNKSVIKLTPTHLRLLLNNHVNMKFVERLIVGGENFTGELAKRFKGRLAPACLVVNEYGPTELTVGCVSYLFDAGNFTLDRDNVPIGELCDNTSAILINSHGLPCKEFEKGELLVTGRSLSPGYMGNSDKLITHFFEGDNYYRTGDICYRIGNILYYVERLDDQVKVNGFRVNLRDISMAIEKILKGSHVETRYFSIEGNGQLISYVADFCGELPSDLSSKLKRILPKSHIPQEIIKLEESSLSQSGKFKQPSIERSRPFERQTNMNDEWESVVYSLWEMFLNKNKSELTKDSHFYELGGNSMKLLEMFSHIEKWFVVHDKERETLERLISKFIAEPTLASMLSFN
ncbi:MAG: non-ribosomal peptide synthetase [Bdellovibrionota bacterium]|nr:non-ribosomal peptide synthetase [Bdellovibrionota bacterium]